MVQGIKNVTSVWCNTIVILQIFQTEGILGFFAGYGATLLRDVPYTMMELGLYENIKTMIRCSKQGVLTSSDEFTAAAIAGAISGYITSKNDAA